MSATKSKIEITPELTRQLAMRRAVGASVRELEKEFELSRFLINKTLNTDMAKAIIKGLIDDAVTGAVITVRRRLADMTDLAMNVIEQNLKEGSLEAVKIYFKGIGMDGMEKPDNAQQQTIQVILPGHQQPKDIEVESGDV